MLKKNCMPNSVTALQSKKEKGEHFLLDEKNKNKDINIKVYKIGHIIPNT